MKISHKIGIPQAKGAAIVVAFALAISGSEVLATTRNGSNSFAFGNRQAGANGSYAVTVANGPGYSSANLNAAGSVTLLNRTVKGVEFNATAQNSNGRKTCSYALSLAGYTVDTGSKSITYTWNKSVNRTLLTASAMVMAGPVPVTVSGAVGGGASIGYTFSLNTGSVGLDGSAAGWANGSASAGLGVPGFNLSLQADLTLARSSLNAGLQITPAALSGSTYLGFDPLRVDFGVALKALGVVVYRYDLGHYATPSRSCALLRL